MIEEPTGRSERSITRTVKPCSCARKAVARPRIPPPTTIKLVFIRPIVPSCTPRCPYLTRQVYQRLTFSQPSHCESCYIIQKHHRKPRRRPLGVRKACSYQWLDGSSTKKSRHTSANRFAKGNFPRARPFHLKRTSAAGSIAPAAPSAKPLRPFAMRASSPPDKDAARACSTLCQHSPSTVSFLSPSGATIQVSNLASKPSG